MKIKTTIIGSGAGTAIRHALMKESMKNFMIFIVMITMTRDRSSENEKSRDAEFCISGVGDDSQSIK